MLGELPGAELPALAALVRSCVGRHVGRSTAARSETPFPKSTDLELALLPTFLDAGFVHHQRLAHPQTGEGFEFDFWRARDGVAVEIMGYRADDEVYKDVLKFHVHDGTRVGMVWVPRWKWVGGRRTETNYRAAMKARAFADRSLAVAALLAVVYDWDDAGPDRWALRLGAP